MGDEALCFDGENYHEPIYFRGISDVYLKIYIYVSYFWTTSLLVHKQGEMNYTKKWGYNPENWVCV